MADAAEEMEGEEFDELLSELDAAEEETPAHARAGGKVVDEVEVPQQLRVAIFSANMTEAEKFNFIAAKDATQQAVRGLDPELDLGWDESARPLRAGTGAYLGGCEVLDLT